jgi:hypothetical protein
MNTKELVTKKKWIFELEVCTLAFFFTKTDKTKTNTNKDNACSAITNKVPSPDLIKKGFK